MSPQQKPIFLAKNICDIGDMSPIMEIVSCGDVIIAVTEGVV